MIAECCEIFQWHTQQIAMEAQGLSLTSALPRIGRSMGAAKRNPTTITAYGPGRFAASFVSEWEAERCVAFAVAIERLRGWPVHTTSVGQDIVRFQSEHASDWIYDPRGIFTSTRFSDAVAIPLIKQRRDWPPSAFENGHLRIGTKCVGEEGLAELGIACDEDAIRAAVAQIEANVAYLSLVPERPYPRLTAKALSRYSWSGCVVYAEALSRITGLPAMTMVATQTAVGHDITGGRFHAVVSHPDGSVEDVWGRQSPEAVGRRYAMMRWHLDAQAHQTMIEEAFRIRPAAHDDIAEADALIRQCRVNNPNA